MNIKKGQHVAATRVQEQVHVGVGRMGGGHLVFGNGQHEAHVQVFHIPLDGFFGVFATISGMVNFANFHDIPLGVYLKGATSNLITF